MELSKMRITKICFMLIILIISTPAFANQKSDSLNQIVGQKVYQYCKTISSPKFEGRLGGSPGYIKSAKWVREKFKDWGLCDSNG